MRWPLRSSRGLELAVLVLALGLFVYSAALLGRAVAVSTNSDDLYLSAMYRDLFIDGVGLRSWHAQPAPSFFPDLPLFFLARLVTRNSAAATWAYADAELCFGVFCVAQIARLLDVKSRLAAWSAALLSMSVLAYFNAFGEFFHLGFSPSCHESCSWVSAGVAILVARQMKARRPRRWAMLAVLVLTALTGTSDHLYLVHTAALVLALGLCLFVTRGPRGVMLLNMGAMALGVAVVPWLDKVPARFGIEVDPHPPAIEFSWKRILYVLDRLPPPDNEPTAIALYTTVLGIAFVLGASVCVLAIAGFARRRDTVHRGTLTFLAAAFVSTICCVLCGNAFSGAYWNEYSARYMHALYVLPYLVLPIACLLAGPSKLGFAIPAMVAAVPAVNGWPKVVDSMKPLLGGSVLYPAPVGCVDRIARRFGVKFGYADYWYARRIAELSKVGLHLVAVFPWCTPGDGLCNRSWYARVADASPFMVLTTRLDVAAVRARFGEPMHVESCSGCCTLAGPDGGCAPVEVWVYSGRPRTRIVP